MNIEKLKRVPVDCASIAHVNAILREKCQKQNADDAEAMAIAANIYAGR